MLNYANSKNINILVHKLQILVVTLQDEAISMTATMHATLSLKNTVGVKYSQQQKIIGWQILVNTNMVSLN